MARLALMLLGSFQVILDGHPVAFAADKVRALLAYLAVESDRLHPRESLAGLLWPDYAESSARQSLNQALYSLRGAIGDRAAQPPYLLITRDTLRFNPESDYQLDLTELSRDLRAIRELQAPEAIARLQKVVTLYRGLFLEGFSLSDSAPFEEWATLKREEYSRLVLAALHRLVELHEREGSYEDAQRWARRQVELEPLDERAHRQLMRALALGGQRSAALAQYEACLRLLADELGVEPGEETTALYQQIRSGALVLPPHAPGPRVTESTHLPSSEAPNLPLPEPPRPLFVAREQELARLEQWLSEALHGQGRVGFVAGEPGSGKTALLRAFARRAMDTYPDLIVAGGTGDAYTGSGDPYLPFRETLGMLAGDVEGPRAVGAISREHARRLRALAPATAEALLERGPELIDLVVSGKELLARLPEGAHSRALLEELLRVKASAPAPGRPSPTALLDQSVQVLLALARKRPLLLMLDDLQWADGASINLLFHLGRRLAGAGEPSPRLLILGAYRPEEVALGHDGERHPLDPVLAELRRLWGETTLDLALAAGRELVDALVDSEPHRLGNEFRETLYRRTGGHALFTAELLRSLRDGGGLERDAEGRWVEGPGLDWESLPARVEAVIEERIGRLSAEEQEMLALASVEGEEFHADVLARVQGRDEGMVIRLLSGALSKRHRLVAATALQAWQGRQLSRYHFRHYLFQHFLYGRLDDVERAHLHGQVGLALEALYGPLPGPSDLAQLIEYLPRSAYIPEDPLTSPQWAATLQLARHFEAARMTTKALAYLWRAAWRAYQVEGLDQALPYVAQVPAMIATLPDTAERTLLEYWAQSMLAHMYGWSKSFIAPEVRRALMQGYDLAQRLGRPSIVSDALEGLAVHYSMGGEISAALGYHQRALDILREHEPALLQGHRGTQYVILLYSGELAQARAWYEPFYAPLLETPPRTDGFPYLDDPSGLARVPWLVWALGYPDRALVVGQAVLTMSHASRVPLYVSSALRDSICFLHQFRREVAPLEQALRELAPLAGRLGRPGIGAHVTLFQGWIQAQRGALEEGIETLRRGLEQWAQNHLVLLPYWKGVLAEALARAGQVEEGLALLEGALEQAERAGEGWSLSEICRLKGALLLQHGDDPKEVEARFQQSLEIARRQKAKSWELRATVSLCRLLQKQGRRDEARQALAAIYGWFTEGFDTPDLIEAKALLDALGQR